MELLCQHRQAELLRQMLLQIPGDAGDGPLLLLLRLCGGGNPALKQGNFQIAFLCLFLFAQLIVPYLTYLQPDQSLFIERAAEAYGKKGKIEAQHLAFELTELFASGELTPQDMDGIMYEMHKAYFKYREQKREKERIMNL